MYMPSVDAFNLALNQLPANCFNSGEETSAYFDQRLATPRFRASALHPRLQARQTGLRAWGLITGDHLIMFFRRVVALPVHFANPPMSIPSAQPKPDDRHACSFDSGASLSKRLLVLEWFSRDMYTCAYYWCWSTVQDRNVPSLVR